MIQKQLHEPLKILGKLKLCNGLDINQGKYFIKISCKLDLTKILESHNLMEPSNKTHNTHKTKMRYNKEHFNKMHETKGPDTLED